jgi:hypothetical protein
MYGLFIAVAFWRGYESYKFINKIKSNPSVTESEINNLYGIAAIAMVFGNVAAVEIAGTFVVINANRRALYKSIIEDDSVLPSTPAEQPPGPSAFTNPNTAGGWVPPSGVGYYIPATQAPFGTSQRVDPLGKTGSESIY